MTKEKDFDAIIIGGSYAGLSAAMALGRSLRKVLIIDSGLPCNRQTPHSHNFITQDGEMPAVITQIAKEQVLSYDTVSFLSDLAVSALRKGDGFSVSTSINGEFSAKKLIIATGIRDLMPVIDGFSECWGISVVHCPYCHGYEFKGLKTGIMANGERAFHLASLVSNLTKDVTLLTSGKAVFSAEEVGKLKANGIEIIETEVETIVHEEGFVNNVLLKDGRQFPFKALYAAVPFEQHSDIPALLGCEMTEQGYIQVNDFQQTTVPGVYACGDNSSMMRAVANAVYRGNVAGAMVNRELV